MKSRFLVCLIVLLVVATMLPCPVMAVEASPVNATGLAEEVSSSDVDLRLDEMPEFQLIAPEADATDDADTTVGASVMAAQADEADAESASADIPKSAAPKKLTLGVKEKYTLKVSGAKKYKSSNTKVATVSKKGVIKGRKAGQATITVTTKDGKKTRIALTVRNKPGSVSLNKTKVTLKVGKTCQLKAKLPSKTASNKLTWTSDNKKVAKVSAAGKVTALKAGKARITVKTYNGVTAVCTVTVKQASRGIDLTSYFMKNITDMNSSIGVAPKETGRNWYYDDDGKKYYYSEEDEWYKYYEYGCLTVYADKEGIIKVMKLTDSSGGYSIEGVTVGMSPSEAVSALNARKWDGGYNGNDVEYFYPDFTFMEKYDFRDILLYLYFDSTGGDSKVTKIELGTGYGA